MTDKSCQVHAQNTLKTHKIAPRDPFTYFDPLGLLSAYIKPYSLQYNVLFQPGMPIESDAQSSTKVYMSMYINTFKTNKIAPCDPFTYLYPSVSYQHILRHILFNIMFFPAVFRREDLIQSENY
jgi:hypothetical protein